MKSIQKIAFFLKSLALVLTFLQKCNSLKAPTFTDTNLPIFHTFINLVVHKDTGWVYVGAMNRIYQLSPNLTLIAKHKTGPRSNIEQLPDYRINNDLHRSTTKWATINEVLLLDYNRSQLISCDAYYYDELYYYNAKQLHFGNPYTHNCFTFQLQNISQIRADIFNAEVWSTSETPTTPVAFIAPGPLKSEVLYFAVTNPLGSDNSTIPPSIATRSLERSNFFDALQKNTTASIGPITNRYPTNYIYGFSSGLFSYFLTNQLSSSSPGSRFITKIVRICQGDNDIGNSYIEMPLECKLPVSGGTSHNLVEAAYVAKPSAELALSLGISTYDDILFATFSEAVAEFKFPKPTGTSVLCMFPLGEINSRFAENIRYLTTYGDYKSKAEDYRSASLCGLHLHSPILGPIPMVASPLYRYFARLTAIAITTDGVSTVVFLGSKVGTLMTLYVKNRFSALDFNNVRNSVQLGLSFKVTLPRYERTNISSILKMQFGPNEGYLYVMGERKVARVVVQQCSAYKICETCLNAKQYLCGWCPQLNKCTLKSTCWYDWISHETGTCPRRFDTELNEWRLPPHTLRFRITNNSWPSSIECRFFSNGEEVITPALDSGNSSVNCRTPLLHFNASGDQHQLTSELSVVDPDFPEELSIVNITFYNCHIYSTCGECVSSPFPCSWCVASRNCIFTEESNSFRSCESNDLTTRLFTNELQCISVELETSNSSSKVMLKRLAEYERNIVSKARIFKVWVNESDQGVPEDSIKIAASGKNLLFLMKPRFVVSNEDKTTRYYGHCQVHDDSFMECSLPLFLEDFVRESQLKLLRYGFEDESGVEVAVEQDYPSLILYPDPIFKEVKINAHCANNTFYTLHGRHIDTIYRKEDFIVKFGDVNCGVVSVSRKSLVCVFSPEKDSYEQVNVTIKVGKSLTFNVGTFECKPKLNTRHLNRVWQKETRKNGATNFPSCNIIVNSAMVILIIVHCFALVT